MKGQACDLGLCDITINNVQPGLTDMALNPVSGAFADTMRTLNAPPRYGNVEEVAGMVAYLAGPEAGYITGANLMIDGGFSA